MLRLFLVRVCAAAAVLTVMLAGAAVPVSADHCDFEEWNDVTKECSHDDVPEDSRDGRNDGDSDDGGGDGGGDVDIDIGLGPVVEKLEELLDFFTGGNEPTLKNVIKEAILATAFTPIRAAAKAVILLLEELIAWYPQVYPNPDVESVHRVSLQVAAVFTAVVFAAAGVDYMLQDYLRFKPHPALWKTVPRTIGAMAVASVSLPLLQHVVEGTEIVTRLFLVGDVPELSEVAVTGGLIIAGAVNVLLVVAVAAVYVLKAAYVVYVAGLSPVILLLWAAPWTRKYAAPFVKGFVTALLLGPFSAAAFRLSAALFAVETPGNVPDWLLATGMLLLLLALPFMMWSASGQLMAQTGKMARSTRRKTVRELQRSDRVEVDRPFMRFNDDDDDDDERGGP